MWCIVVSECLRICDYGSPKAFYLTLYAKEDVTGVVNDFCKIVLVSDEL